jgi:CubicO group peptidase (beta-lactamase class C family)
MHALSRREFGVILSTLATSPLLQTAGAAAQASTTGIRPPDDAFLGTLPKLMEISDVPGIGIGVVRGGKLTFQRYEGVADVSTGKPVTADTLFPAASLGKPVFAYAALRLADDGKLDLERPLKAYVPDHTPADVRGDKVTARHVLAHSSGYRNWRNSVNQPLIPDFDPGSRFQYSGEGFYYLQRAVEKITAGPFEQFMQQRLFGPFGMRSSTYGWRHDTEARLVTGHNRGNPSRPPSRDFANRLFQHAQSQGKGLASFSHEDIVVAMGVVRPSPAPLPNFIIPNAAGSMLTTVSDYAAFLSRVLAPAGEVLELKPKTLQQMLSPVTRINGVISWGLGWGLESDAGRDYIWHWGDNGNFKNFVLAHLASQSAIVVFTNGNNGLRVAEAAVAAASGHAHFAFDWV